MTVETYSEQKTIVGLKYEMEIILDYFNKRLKIEDYRGNTHLIINESIKYAEQHQFEKIIIKSRGENLLNYLEFGFMLEAIIPGYFRGSDAYYVAKYLSTERKNSHTWLKEEQILTNIQTSKRDQTTSLPSTKFKIRKASTNDAENLADFYNQIFKIYPTPLNKPEYIKNVINDNTIFYLIEDQGLIISAASAEINFEYKNAELTDCATLETYRKHGLMKILLMQLEQQLLESGIFSAYSIARSLSYGMNACFYQLGYSYTGRLTNNCYIYDKLEDMNMWVKDLSK